MVAEGRGEGPGEEPGVAAGFTFEFAIKAGAGVGLAFELEFELEFELVLAGLRGAVLAAEFLLALTSDDGGGDALRWFALEFLFATDVLAARAESRPVFAAAAGFPPGTLKTTSSLFECCST
jgi:hypothetical protein